MSTTLGAISSNNPEGTWMHTAGPEAGLSVLESGFLLWSPGEPTNDTGESCATFFFGGYYARNCSYRANYVVEFECSAAIIPGRCNSTFVAHSFQIPNSHASFIVVSTSCNSTTCTCSGGYLGLNGSCEPLRAPCNFDVEYESQGLTASTNRVLAVDQMYKRTI